MRLVLKVLLSPSRTDFKRTNKWYAALGIITHLPYPAGDQAEK